MPPRIDPADVAYWADLAARLRAAGRGGQGAIVDAAAAAQGISRHTVYERLKTYGGWTSGRKRRAGQSKVSEEALMTMATIYQEGVRENHKQVMTVAVAASIAEASGLELPVSNSQLGRLMRQQRLDRRSQDLARSFVTMRSDHPNQVHQADPSLCLVYYAPGGEQRIIRESEFYKNKLEAGNRIKLKVWRYVVTDHASGLIYVRYIEARGESARGLFDALVWAWGRQPGRTGHGVPLILVMDPGSANTSHSIRSFLEALDVQLVVHQPEAPWAKGQVETSNNIIERHFESRLRFEPVDSCEALNQAALAWAEAYNANALPRIDSRLHRKGATPFTRTEAWLRIRAEQLRELPAPEVCAKLLEGKALERTVSGHAIQYRHPDAPHSLAYNLKSLAEIHNGDKVRVSPLLLGESRCMIRLRWTGLDGQEQTWRLPPVEALNDFGLPLAAPTWDGEYKAHKKRDAEYQADALARLAYPEQTDAARDPLAARRAARQKQVTPLGGTLDAISHLSQIKTPTYLPRAGAPIALDVPEERREAVPLVRALLRLSQAWGRPLADAEHDWMTERFGAAVPADELDRLLAAGSAGDPPAPAVHDVGRPALAVVR